MAELQQILQVAGVPAVFGAKARAFFKAHRDARLAKGKRWMGVGGWMIPLGGLSLAGGAAGIYANINGVQGADAAGVGGIMGAFVLTIGGFIVRSHGKSYLDAPEVVPDLQRLLRALADDWAAKQPLDGQIDLRPASDAVESERSARSPYSGATKLYYRHRWFRAAGRLVDGTHLAIEGTALVKTKSGHEIRRELQLRGRLRPGTVLGRPSWKGERDFGRLHTVVDGDELLFWAPVQAMDEVLPDLERIVRKLAGLPEDPGGGAVGKA